MFYKPAEAAAFTNSPTLKKTMQYVYTFCSDNGLLKDMSNVAIQFPDGSQYPEKGKVHMWFNSTYMQMAADGQL